MDYKEIQDLKSHREYLEKATTQTYVMFKQGCMNFIENELKRHGDYNGTMWKIKLHKKNQFKFHDSPVEAIGYLADGRIVLTLLSVFSKADVIVNELDLNELEIGDIVDAIHKQCKNKC